MLLTARLPLRALTAAALLCLLVPAWTRAMEKPPKITGTYSGVSRLRSLGEQNTLELRIVPTNEGYQGIVQRFARRPLRPSLAEVAVDGERISFSFSDPTDGAIRIFQGRIDQTGLTGVLRVKGRPGFSYEYIQRKTGTYWDEP
ncbi:MAG TPA: hypothetical protein PKB11_14835 [Desulfovibrio sp.]|jgi:hypothetical protein|uniref:hypothetical protein n=1 Tax=Desulfovibrio sp. TaxID=885 RepID=UPI002A4C54D7|nr:hypothetical protein [Desulfovibrio sp.]MDY0307663.1 hypothetical protein [Desulfovibrionaceae bacterium]HMM40031.1 hypothetical protein [Desulfovibrio sp.]